MRGVVRRAGEEDGWVYQREARGVEVWLKSESGTALSYIKGVGSIPAEPAVVRDFFANLEVKRQWDELFDSGHVEEQVNFVTR